MLKPIKKVDEFGNKKIAYLDTQAIPGKGTPSRAPRGLILKKLGIATFKFKEDYEMLTDSVIVILENRSGHKFFDRVIYLPHEEREMVDRRIELMDTFGYKAKMVEIPLVGFDLHSKWDVFLAYAMAYGVPYDLAFLGRECMRRASEHHWDAELRSQYYLGDDAQETIQFALQEPKRAREGWSNLIRSKGQKS